MRRKIIVTAVTVLLSLGTFVNESRAQAGNCQVEVVCSVYDLYNNACIPPIPLGAHACGWNGPWSWMCLVPSDGCNPTPCPTCNSANAGQPIDLATGNTYISASDLRIPGLGGGLSLSRTWNSTTTGYGMFGLGWTSNLEEKIYVGGDYLVKNLRSDGSIWSYGFSGYGSDGNSDSYLLAGPKNGGASASLGPSTFTITLKSGEQKVFDRNTGSLLSSADRNGNKTALLYDSSNRLVTVTDPASRHLYFTYSQAGQLSVVSSVTSDCGLSLSYQYDNTGRLVQVTAPDNSFVSYTYSSSNLITAVTDTNGRVLESHTYDSSGRGLTSSKAGGVNAVSVTYSY